jgi:DNA-binding winged helix-turn-helix (wHTH) protein/tetratricopeptide (TPR) repeat protein
MSLDLESNKSQNNLKAAKPSGNIIYEFEGFRLDAMHLMLCRQNGDEIALTPKQVETLLALVERNGEIVGKEELMDRLWANSFVEESNLTQNVHILRKVLGDTAGGKPMIETLRRRGYRFNGDLTRVQAVQAPIVYESESADKFSERPAVNIPDAVSTAGIKGPRRKWAMASALVAVSVIAIAIGGYFYSRGVLGGSKNTRSIAVLPLKPIDAASRSDIYEIGIADSLILKLGTLKGLVVRPLSATRNYAEISQDPLAAGREQQVDYVLASNYQLAGGKIRVTSQLFNVANGQIEETYKGGEKDAAAVFAMQDEIANEIGNIISARFAAVAGPGTGRRGTANEEAYRLFLQGMYFVDKEDPAAARKALEMFDQAISLDPNYAQAWSGTAHAHRTLANRGRNANTDDEYKASMAAVNKALSLDQDLADAHSALCENKMQYERDYAGAERECKRAIELDPNSALGHQIYSRYLFSRGRFDDAIAEIKTSIDLGPASVFSQRVYGSSLYFARRYPEAVTQLKRVIVMDPDYPLTYPWLWQSLETQGNYAEAFDSFMKFQALLKADGDTVKAFSDAYQSDGWHGVLVEQAKRFDSGNLAFYHGAVLNARIGNKDKAFAYLESSFQRHELWMNMLRVDPGLDTLRDDPRFDDLVRRVGL